MKKIWIGAGVVVLIIALVGVNLWKQQGTSTVTVETTILKKETMAETVMTPGTLKLNREQNVYYEPEIGEIAEVYVSEGDTIEKGEKLLRYENKQLQLEEKQTDLQLRLAYLDVNNIREQHKNIDKQIEEDPNNELLHEEHDQIKLQQQQANIEIEQIELQKENIDEQKKRLIVKSDIDGTVVSIDEQATIAINQGEQKSIIRIGSLNNLIVEGSISEYDTLKIKEDQPVTLTSDVVPDEKWQGKVTLIGELPKESNGMGLDSDHAGVEYPLIASVEGDMNLKPGFQMLIDIETSKHETSTLPLSAVIQEEESDYVFIVKEGLARKTKVKIGSVTIDKIEVIDGVKSKDQVIIEPDATILDGMEVTVK